MASGGLPPTINPMPPPRGWTPGPPTEPAQNHQDETLANSIWERLIENGKGGRELQFSEQCENVIAYWAFLATDPLAQRLDTPLFGERIKKLIRIHQMLVVDPKWVEDVHDELKIRLAEKMSAAEAVVKKWKHTAEFTALKNCHPNAWNPPILRDILSGKSKTHSTDYFFGESFDVCMKRLQVLLDSKLDIPAYHLTTFLVRHVFEDYHCKRPKFSFLMTEWLQNSRDKAHIILYIHLAILYRRKEDSSKLQYVLKSLPIEALLYTAEICRDPKLANHPMSWVSSLWTEDKIAKVCKDITDFAMCSAARKKMEAPLVKQIVSVWLKILNLDPDDSNLDIEVEKFVELDEHSFLSYIIGHRLISKYGRTKRELSLEQIVHGLCQDMNKMEVAKFRNDDDTVKLAENSLSYGLQTLAEVMKEHLTFRRECILTAFSLTPTRPLYEKIVGLAQESGFVTEESKIEDSETSEAKMEFPTEAKDFDALCQDFLSNLKSKGFAKAPTKIRANAVLCEKKNRNLEGLISIQGDLVTEAKNYDPVEPPLKTMTAAHLGISQPRLVDDLLTMINGPRWHLLSWVLDWPQLDEQCKALLRNPDMKRPTKELKYLVIDYTQFDEWSSEEEITATTGIEKGFESWVTGHDSDPEEEEETITEKGLDPSEPIDFNVIPILDEQCESDFEAFDKDYVQPMDYLPQTQKASFLGVTEEVTKKDLLPSSKTSEDVRATLNRVVPGLNDLSCFPVKSDTEYQVRVVQVVQSTSTPSTTSAASTSTTSNVLTASTASPKVQYVYKQGGQTVLIDYPMSSTSAAAAGASSSQDSSSKIVKTEAVTGGQSKILSGSSSSVDTLANSLISQITTPVNVNNGASSLPKFQFAFGASNSNSNALGAVVQASSGNNNKRTAATIVQAVSTAGGKVQYNTIMQRPANARPGPGAVNVVVPVVTVEGGSAQTVIANARSALVTTASASTSQDTTNADLIRQLNVARAQGDVCIQHWGDKQVLVHKATGRWIMRQGNRLVTVPPQALGLTTTTTGNQTMQVVQSASSSSEVKAASVGQTIVRSMSSSTMEQLAEFDSILESKFKSSPSPPMVNNSLPDVVASTAPQPQPQRLPVTSTGPTFVIIAPSSSSSSDFANTFMTSGGRNIVAVSVGNSPIKREPIEIKREPIEIKREPPSEAATSTVVSKINGSTFKIASSAPNSPVKSVKIQQSVSANSSPTQSATSAAASAAAAAAVASSFVKPPPKPQEDPDTLKRIQQILDDYNEQIRNSPDLQNRPAPRRRTNGPIPITGVGITGITTTATTTTPPPPGLVSPLKKRPSLSSGSPNSSCGSESPSLMIQNQSDFDSGSPSIVQLSMDPGEASKQPQSSKPILRQIMVPPALAASLQATGKQLVFITGAGGKKVIAMRSMASPGSMVKTARIVTSTSSISPRVTLQQSSPPNFAPNPILCSSPSSPTSMTLTTTTVASMEAASNETRPVTPILGIPMEMTPGQIMEAEISGTYLDDDDSNTAVQPQEPATSTTTSIHLVHQEAEIRSECNLPENLFTHEPTSPGVGVTVLKPPVITEETEVDTDDVTEDEASSTSVIAVNNKRKRPSSGSNSAQIGAEEKRIKVATAPASVLRSTRTRNLSSHKKSGLIQGITTESSRSSISTKKSSN